MSLNSNALITLDDFKAYYGSALTDKDHLAEIIINGVSQEFDRFCGRVLKQATYTNLYIDGNGQETLPLPNWPAASLTGVYEDSALLTEGLAYDFVLYSSDEDAYLRKVSATWPELDEATEVWLEGPKTIKISSVKLGYATIPADIQLACLKQSAMEFQRMLKSEWGETSRSVGDGSIGLVEPGLLKDVEAVLRCYRRINI